jgi:hypothetical protein
MGKMIEHIPVVRLELRPSNIHAVGVGVFAVRPVQREEKIADGVAEEEFECLVPWEKFRQFDGDLQRKIMAFCVGTPEGFVPPPDFDFNKLSIEWFFNHSCEGNCGFDDQGDFVAIRDVARGEELSYDYALIESNPNFSLKCSCESKNCRHVVTGNDWKNEGFASKNRQHMHPRLRRLLPVLA